MPNYSGVWTLSQQFQARGQGLWPAAPGAPTIGTATAGTSLCASVTFTAPSCKGNPGTITGYLVTSTPGCKTASGSSSPLTVTGLTCGTSYTFKVKAQNATGYGACSAASNSITAAQKTCATYTTPGTYSWVAPTGVTSIAVVVVGGGGGGASGGSQSGFYAVGGGGGALAYRNAVSVTPGNSYTLVVGAAGKGGSSRGAGSAGGVSYFCNAGISEARANGGAGGPTSGQASGGTVAFGGGGGAGGISGYPSGVGNGGGGGAGGYAGAGGAGGNSKSSGSAGAGGGGGGGGGGGYRYFCCGTCAYWASGSGGGVGIYGQGCSGFGGGGSCNGSGLPGGAGSGATYGNANYGGGGGSGAAVYYPCSGWGYGCGYNGGTGAVRIVWAGGARGTPSFPKTNVGP